MYNSYNFEQSTASYQVQKFIIDNIETSRIPFTKKLYKLAYK